MDITDWLRGLGLEQYAPGVRENDIDGKVLRRLTAEDLRELGIASVGHRRHLLDAIAALETAEASPAPAPAAVVSGEPGIGKSRLTAALSQHIESEPHTRLRYFCSPHHQDSALRPFIVQLEHAAGFAREDPAEAKRDKLRKLLAPAAPGGDEVELVAELLSLPNSGAGLNLSPQRRREMLFEALLHQLEALARLNPVLMIFEDAHWIDPTTRELLDLTIDRVAQLPVLLVVSFRPEFQHAWSGPAHVTAVALNRLGGHDGAALVAGVGRQCRPFARDRYGDRRAHRWGAVVRRGADQSCSRKRRSRQPDRRGAGREPVAERCDPRHLARLAVRTARSARDGRP